MSEFRNIILLLCLITALTMGLFASALYMHQVSGKHQSTILNSNVDSKETTDGTDYSAAYALGLSHNAVGESLFKNNCKQCHTIESAVIGPALKNVHDRRSTAWLHSFISNPEKMIKSNDKAAVALFAEYKQIMPSHDFLSAPEIDSIIAYIKFESAIR